MIRGRSEHNLACGHTFILAIGIQPPTPGDELYCLRCGDYSYHPYPLQTNIDGNPIFGPYRWRCLVQKCAIARTHGQDKAQAVRVASRHIRMYPHHYVHVINPNGLIVERFGDSSQVTQPQLFR